VAGRWSDPSAFRADPAATPAARPTGRQTIALLLVLLLVAGAVAVASYAIRPEKARAFQLFHGSVFLANQQSPVAVDLASGQPTLLLLDAAKQVSATGRQQLGVVPLDSGTLLLNKTTGEFNMVASTGFLVKHDGSGVPLGSVSGTTSAMGIADGQLAYIVRTSSAGTDVYLVSQSTVESALYATKAVKPRASTTMTDAVADTDGGGAVAADGALWLLVDRGVAGEQTLRRLSVPDGSSAGAVLSGEDQGTVAGPAALATATDGSGTTVGVASADRIRLWRADGKARTIRFQAPAGVDKVFSATNADGRLAYLLHGRRGWTVVSVDADGSGLTGPRPVGGVPGGAVLAQPTYSGGRLYTIDRRDGRLYRIALDGRGGPVPGMPGYPVVFQQGKPTEASSFADVEVIGREARVIVNSPTHNNAVMIFADGSHRPRAIRKSSAVTVSASGGAEALTRSNVNPGQPSGPPPPKGSKPKPTGGQVVNNKIDCRNTTQKPHIPRIDRVATGSRSVTLSWSYPILDRTQDCYPSTYVVGVRRLSTNAPNPPSSVTVQSQTGATITGLFPETSYELTVTAYINGQGTAAEPVRVDTGSEGPKAPTGLSVTADSSGNWILNWDSCGTVQEGCVPAQSWTVTPSFCDSRGVSSPPDPVVTTADPTSRRQPTVRYPGGDDLLGRGLQFVVTGAGASQVLGTPSAKSPCVYSWGLPIASDLSVSASSPPPTAQSTATSATTVTVKFAKGQVHDLGGVGGTLTYQLLSGGHVVATKGPTTEPSVSLAGIRPGQRYQVQVLASPPRHPNVVAKVGPVDVVPAIADWPALTVSAPTFDETSSAAGKVHVKFGLKDKISGDPADTRGETFVLTSASLLRCGDASMDLNKGDAAPGDDLTFDVDRRTLYGDSCTVTLQLAQDPRTATDPPLYGAGMSETVTSSPFSIDPPSSTSTAGDFTAQWAGTTTDPQVVVSYHGSDDLSSASNWQITLTNGSTPDCGSVNKEPPATIVVDKDCVKAGGNFTVTVSYAYFLIPLKTTIGPVPVQGTAPRPVDPTKISFSAAWNDNPALPQIDVTYTGSEDTASLAPLDFTETVTSGGVTCAAENDNPATSSARIDIDLATCPPTDANGDPSVYSIEIKFTDPNYGQTGDYTYQVSGKPPA
jgi:hypothetical protein